MKEEVQTFVWTQLNALKKRQVSISFLLIFQFLVVLAGMGFVGYRSVVVYERQVAQVEAREVAVRQENLRLQREIAADRVLLKKMAEEQEKLFRRLEARDRETERRIAELRKELAAQTPEQVAETVEEELAVQPIVQEGQLCFEPSEVTEFIVTKLDRDRLQANLRDALEMLTIEKQRSVTLLADLEKSEQMRKNAEKIAKDYKGLVKKTKWKKFLGGMKWVATHTVVAVVARAL